MNRPELRQRLFLAAVITLAFALLAWKVRGVSGAGAITGFLLTLALFIGGGPKMFAAELLVFVLTFIATRIGRSRKKKLRIAERESGRDAAQVIANVGCAALAAALAQLTPWRIAFLTASIAALAEAASDTVSSESGKALTKTARLITSFKPVLAGTDGGISLPGTVLGMAAAVVIGFEAAATGLLSVQSAMFAVAAAIAGMFLDSLLGATLERRKWIGNNAVNLISSVFSAVAALVFVRYLARA